MYLMIMKFLLVSTLKFIPWYNGYNERDEGGGRGLGKTVSGQCNIMCKFTFIKTPFSFLCNNSYMHKYNSISLNVGRWGGGGGRKGRR